MPTFPTIIIPIAVILIVFLIFLLFFAVNSLFNVYHLLRFGVAGPGLYAITGVYVLGSLVLLGLSITILAQYDWTIPLSLNELLNASQSTILPGL